MEKTLRQGSSPRTKKLILRAGSGFHPVWGHENLSSVALTARAPLRLEGIEFRHGKNSAPRQLPSNKKADSAGGLRVSSSLGSRKPLERRAHCPRSVKTRRNRVS